MPETVPNFLAALTALGTARVRFVLVGGLAMVAQGSASITDDIDICYAPGPGHLAAFVTALEPFHPRLRDASEGSLFQVEAVQDALSLALTTDLADIDFYSDTPGIASFDTLWQQSVTVDLNGTMVHAASVTDLIAMKRIRGTVGDNLHLLELEALCKLQANSQV